MLFFFHYLNPSFFTFGWDLNWFDNDHPNLPASDRLSDFPKNQSL
jgi:hypothetical protein